ncbi:MAG: hypothetical protein LBP19_02790 [Treponema sp.]|nr:hypothetical protein [Treponema sp.]
MHTLHVLHYRKANSRSASGKRIRFGRAGVSFWEDGRRTRRAAALAGLDIQINGASPQSMRQSIAMWNDLTGNPAQGTSGYGVLKLVKKE